MILDQTHKKWIIWTGGVAAASTGAYVYAEITEPGGVTGGTLAGLIFGFAAAGLMAFEGLLAAKKRKPAWRVGRASTWMRGHIWLGFLAIPLVLFHSGFHAGGPISKVLLILFTAVSLSGIFGLVLQQFVPHIMTTRVEMETIYEQIPHVVDQLREEAEGKVKKLQVEPVNRFFRDEMASFLKPGRIKKFRLGHEGRAEALFDQLRKLVPSEHHEIVDDLEHICEERRQLALQVKLHHWLHGWLIFHVPCSYGLLLLVTVHAVVTLIY